MRWGGEATWHARVAAPLADLRPGARTLQPSHRIIISTSSVSVTSHDAQRNTSYVRHTMCSVSQYVTTSIHHAMLAISSDVHTSAAQTSATIATIISSSPTGLNPAGA
eukprot:5142314-Pyramimonas_sp.AAC.1